MKERLNIVFSKIKTWGTIFSSIASFLVITVIFLLLWADIETNRNKLLLKNSRGQHYYEEMAEVLHWLKLHSSAEEVVLSEWTEGNFVVALADRGVVATSKVYPSEAKEVAERYKDLKKFFFAENESDAMVIINKYKVRWIYLRKKPDLGSIIKSGYISTQRYTINNQLTPEGAQKTIIGRMLSQASFSNFQLVLDAPDFLIYRVEPFPSLLLTNEEKIFLLNLARKTMSYHLSGNKKNSLEDGGIEKLSDNLKHRATVDVAIYVDGKLRGSQIVAEKTIPEAVVSAALMTIVDARFAPLKKEELSRTTIEIYILGDKIPAGNINFSAKRPPEYFGRKGFYLFDEKTGKDAYFLPSVFNKIYFNDIESFLSRLCEKASLVKNCFQDENVDIFVYDGQYFAENSDGGVINFEGTVPIDGNLNFSQQSWKEKVQDATRWLIGRQLPYGEFLTSQYPLSESDSEEPDFLRDGLSAFALLRSFKITGDQESFTAAKLTLDSLNNGGILRQKENKFEIIEGREMPAGNLTFVIMTNLSIYEIEKNEKYLLAARAAADYLLLQRNEAGEFLASYGINETNIAGSDIVSGQAITALTHLARVTGDERYKIAAIKAADLEKSEFRSQRKLNNYENLSLASKAWLVNAFAELYKLTNDKQDAEFAIEVADWLISYQQQYGPSSLIGSFPNTPADNYAYTAGTGKVAEAIVDAYWLAKELNLSLEKYKNSLEMALKWLAQFQYEKNTVYIFKPELRPNIIGGLKGDYRTVSLRTDYAGHYIVALAGLIDIKK